MVRYCARVVVLDLLAGRLRVSHGFLLLAFYFNKYVKINFADLAKLLSRQLEGS